MPDQQAGQVPNAAGCSPKAFLEIGGLRFGTRAELLGLLDRLKQTERDLSLVVGDRKAVEIATELPVALIPASADSMPEGLVLPWPRYTDVIAFHAALLLL